jgi:amino acid transporter
MAIPVYFFLLLYLSMLLHGAWRRLAEGPAQLAPVAPPAGAPLTALTGIEEISNGLPCYAIQLSTMLILAVAAITSSSGFPRITAILAGDGLLPRQLKAVGDRLVFQSGILLLAGTTAGVIVLFQADTHALVPLFAVGVFLAFTLSQAGMVVHWRRQRGRAWLGKSIVSGIGALATLVAMLVLGYSRFLEGALITIIVIPLLLAGFLRIHSHYQQVAQELSLRGLPPSLRPARVVVLPEFIPRRGRQAFLHNQPAWLLEAALLYRRSHSGAERVIIDVPYHLRQ